jgi:hypothetical protein
MLGKVWLNTVCYFTIGRWQRTGGSDAQVCADQALRLLLQSLSHAVGEQADGAETAHRQYQSE